MRDGVARFVVVAGGVVAAVRCRSSPAVAGAAGDQGAGADQGDRGGRQATVSALPRCRHVLSSGIASWRRRQVVGSCGWCRGGTGRGPGGPPGGADPRARDGCRTRVRSGSPAPPGRAPAGAPGVALPPPAAPPGPPGAVTPAAGAVSPCGREALAGRQPHLQQDGEHDDHALGDRLGGAGQVVQREDVVERGEDQHAEHGADDRAAAADQQRAADDDGGDGVQLVERAVGGAAGRRPRHEHDRGDAAGDAGQDVELHGVPLHADAGQPGGLGVAADGEGAPAERRPVEQHPAGDRRPARR